MFMLTTRKPGLASLSLAAFCITLAALTGCANLANKPVTNSSEQANPSLLEIKKAQHQANLALIREFSLDGRIGVQADGRGFSGEMHWQHSHQYNNIELYSPLGSKVAGIENNADGVTLTSSDGNTVTSSDVESLTEQTMGWRLPARYLEDWVLGRATDAPIDSATWDESGRLNKLNQDGWEIQYAAYQDSNGYQLPSKLNLRNAKLTLKLVIDHWQTVMPSTSTAFKAGPP